METPLSTILIFYIVKEFLPSFKKKPVNFLYIDFCDKIYSVTRNEISKISSRWVKGPTRKTGGEQMDDELIVQLYWDRSENAISETDRKYGAYCNSIAYGILQSKEDAEESVNDTYMDAWNSMPPIALPFWPLSLGRSPAGSPSTAGET